MNEVRRGDALAGGGDRIEIEMQSGDVIVFEGATIEWLVEGND